MSSRSYNILIINWRDLAHPESGGAEIYLHEVAKRWVSWGHSVTFIGQKYEGGPTSASIDGVNIIRTGGKYSVYLAAAWTYLTRLRKERFDIVIDSINAIPFFTPLYVRVPKIAIIYHLVGDISFMELPFPHSLIVYVVESFLPWLYKKVPVITIAPSSRNELVRRGFPHKNVTFAYPALQERFHYLTDDERNGTPCVLYLGRIKKYKGIDHLIMAMRQVLTEVPDAELLIAGKGDYCKQLEALVRDCGISRRVSFLGWVNEEEKIRLFRQSWVFVLTSKKEGGTSIAVAEAMACHLPSIGTQDALGDIVRDGETGFLVPYASPDVLAQRLIRLLTDGELRRKMGARAKERSAQFNWDNTAREMMATIENVMENDQK